jgi:hypothetical protein
VTVSTTLGGAPDVLYPARVEITEPALRGEEDVMENVLVYLVGAIGLIGAALFIGVFFARQGGNSHSEVIIPNEEFVG